MNRGEVIKRQIQYYSYCLGAILFLVLGKAIGNNGIVYLAVGMESIALFMIFLGDGIVDVYAKMLRIRRKRGQFHDALAIKKRITFLQAFIGILFTVIIFLFADSIALKIFHLERAALIIRILAPVLLFRMFISILLGYFQSFGVYFIVSISFILRQLLFWIFGRLLCENRMLYGEKVAALLKNNDFIGMYGAMGLAISMVITELIILLALVIYYVLSEHNYDKKKMDKLLHKTEGLGETLGNYSYLNTNNILFGLLKRIFVLIPFIILSKNIDASGVFYGKFLVICSIPIMLMCSRYFLLYSRLVSVVRNHDNRMIRENIQTGIQYTWTVSLLVAVLLSVLAPQITEAFFKGDVILKNYLQYGSVIIIVVSLLVFLCLVHLAHNRKIECVITMFITVILYYFIGNHMFAKEQKPEAIIYASIISLLIGVILLGAITIFLFNLRPDYITIFILPLICIGVSGVIVLLMAKYMTPHIGNTISCIVGAILGTILYLAGLSLCRVFSESEIDRLYGPIGRKCLSYLFK